MGRRRASCLCRRRRLLTRSSLPIQQPAARVLARAAIRGAHSLAHLPPLSILHRDDRLVVVDKPPGVLSVPDPGTEARSVPDLLAEQGLRASSVHRLDREVSGVLLLALDAEALQALQDLFRAHAVAKTYWGMAAGHLAPPEDRKST